MSNENSIPISELLKQLPRLTGVTKETISIFYELEDSICQILPELRDNEFYLLKNGNRATQISQMRLIIKALIKERQ